MNGPHAGGFPAANEEFKGPRHVAQKGSSTPEWQIIRVVQFEHARNIKSREAPIEPRLIRVLGSAKKARSICEPEEVAIVHGGIVDRLRPCVVRRELQAVGVALFKRELQSMVDGVGDRWLV